MATTNYMIYSDTITIFDKTIQILAVADDVDIIGRSLEGVKEAFLCLDETAKKLGLVVNQAKTKYMRSGGDGIVGGGTDITVGFYKFERVDHFKYLGSMVSQANEISAEIKIRTISANRCYFGLAKQMKSKLIALGRLKSFSTRQDLGTMDELLMIPITLKLQF
uniref:Uncharacterized protein n=1 Tax=Rhodnius prolixus TaxID=13249 RepID=T1HCB8_RHOPR